MWTRRRFSGANGNWEGNFILSTWSLPDGERPAALRGGNLGGGLGRADALAFDVTNRPVPGRSPAVFGFQDSETHRPAASLTSISWVLRVVVFNESGHLGAGGGLTGLPHIDDLVHHRQLTKISGASNLPTPIAFSPSNKVFAGGDDTKIVLWRIPGT